jgi:hypothetical protein
MSLKKPIVKYGDQFEELRDGDTLPTETAKSIGDTLSKTPKFNFDPSQYSLSMKGSEIVLTPYNQILNGFTTSFDKRYISSDPNSADGLGGVVNKCSDISPNDTDYIPVSSVSKLYRLSFSGLKSFLKTYFDSIYTTMSAVQTWVTSQGYLTSASLTGYATQAWVTSQGYLTSSSLTGYATQVWVNAQGFITNVVSALGYTPANKAGDTFTGSITATNLSGTNTGDETTATIKTKLGAATTSTDGYLTSSDWNTFNNKQTNLVSGTNIKTINNTSVLGSGDMRVGSTIIGYVSITQNASSTLYYAMNIILSGVVAASRIGRAIPFQAGTFKNFYFRTNTQQPASGSQVVTLWADNSATSISVTIAANSAAGNFSDTTNTETITSGQYMCYEVINNATAAGAAIQGISIGFYASN